VLATGYSVDGSQRLAIKLYDPNHPDKEPEISARLGTKSHDFDLAQSSGESLFGFFVANYQPA
jgi:hypothetical protein